MTPAAWLRCDNCGRQWLVVSNTTEAGYKCPECRTFDPESGRLYQLPPTPLIPITITNTDKE